MSMSKVTSYFKYFCLIVLTWFSVNGCHLAKKTVSGTKVMTADENIVRKAFSAQTNWTFLEFRVTGRAEEDDNKVGFMGTLKLEKNKQIFVVLRSTLGFELARVYATRDSVWIHSKMLNIKEKGDWKLAGGKLGYPVDFNSLQGILVQTLFTSSGDQLNSLVEHLIIKKDQEKMHLVTNPDLMDDENGIKYLNDFLIDRESFIIHGTKIRDIKGQWIADIGYQYNKDNEIKKIVLKGIDSERNFSVDINVVKREIKESIDINFDKF